jgi:hypothetical protein
LFLREGNVLDIFKNKHFFPSRNERLFEFHEKLLQKDENGLSTQVFHYPLVRSIASENRYLVGKDHLHETELDYVLLEPLKVQLVYFSTVQQFDVDVSDHGVDFGLGCQVEHSVVFQHFSQLYTGEDLLSSLVILDGFSCMIRVHRAGVDKEEMSQYSVVLFQ